MRCSMYPVNFTPMYPLQNKQNVLLPNTISTPDLTQQTIQPNYWFAPVPNNYSNFKVYQTPVKENNQIDYSYNPNQTADNFYGLSNTIKDLVKGDKKEAINDLNYAIEQTKSLYDKHDLIITKGDIQLHLGDYKNALTSFEQAEKLPDKSKMILADPMPPNSLLYKKAKCHYHLGSTDLAKQEFTAYSDYAYMFHSNTPEYKECEQYLKALNIQNPAKTNTPSYAL